MKWIGQHIWDFISRFRNKVYFENLEGGSSTTALVVDSEGRVFTNTLSAGGDGEASLVRLVVRYSEAVVKGDPVYVSGFHGSNGPVIMSKADSDDAAKMPAFGLADADYAQNAEGYAISLGNLTDLNTSSYSVGDTLYVASGGGLTNTKPLTQAKLIQNVGTVSRLNANNGQVEVTATGRANDVPNLNDGHIFYGDSNNQAVATRFSTLLPTGSESVDDLSDVDTSTTAPSTNDVLKWDGSNWVPAVYNATFTFSVNYNRLDVPNSGTQAWLLVLMGSGQYQSSIVHEVGYNNGPSGAFASAPTIARNGSYIASATGGYPLTTTSNGTVATSTALNYPSGLTAQGVAYIRFTVTATHSGTTDSNGPHFNIYFRNKKFFGPQAASSLTSTQIINLSDSDWMKSTTSNLSADAYTQAQVSITCNNQYVYYCYPSRISGTPVFKINGFGTTFTSLSNVDVTNSAGFEESFKVWQSPQSYDGSLTLTVE